MGHDSQLSVSGQLLSGEAQALTTDLQRWAVATVLPSDIPLS